MTSVRYTITHIDNITKAPAAWSDTIPSYVDVGAVWDKGGQMVQQLRLGKVLMRVDVWEQVVVRPKAGTMSERLWAILFALRTSLAKDLGEGLTFNFPLAQTTSSTQKAKELACEAALEDEGEGYRLSIMFPTDRPKRYWER